MGTVQLQQMMIADVGVGGGVAIVAVVASAYVCYFLAPAQMGNMLLHIWEEVLDVVGRVGRGCHHLHVVE